MNPITLWRRVMMEPAVFFREMCTGSYIKPFLFSVACIAIGMVGVMLSQEQPTPEQITQGQQPPPGMVDILTKPLITGILLFIWAGVIRFFLGIVATRGDYKLILHVCGFATAPYVFLFAPYNIGPVFSFGYGLYLTIIGLQQTHRLDTRQALTVVIIPALLMILAAFMYVVLWVMTHVSPVPGKS